MIKLKNLLLESPDIIKIYDDPELGDTELYFYDDDTVAFCTNNGMALVGIGFTHGDLIKAYQNAKLIPGDTKYKGRLWFNSKIISLWGIYPNREELNNLLIMIKKEFNLILNRKSFNSDITKNELVYYITANDAIRDLNINSKEWRLELPPNGAKQMGLVYYGAATLIPLAEYQNASSKFKEVEHIKPPSAKAPKEFSGYGSYKTYAGLTPTQYHQMISTSESKE